MIRDPSDGSTKQPPSKYSELKAKHGESWGIQPPPDMPKRHVKAPTADELREHYAKFQLGFQPKPDEPT
jgi:hypothetical protein